MISETSYEYSDSDIEHVEAKWAELIVDSDYEINENNVYQIRRKGTNRNIKLSTNKDGYLQCTLNGKKLYHHRVVALQFIKNPDNKPFIDHINHVRTDNRIENLRWATRLENNQNKGSMNGKSFVFTEEIDDECVRIEKYGNRELEGYYYDFNQDIFYKEVETNKYRLLNIYHRKNGQAYLKLYDKNGVLFDLCVKKFFKLYELI